MILVAVIAIVVVAVIMVVKEKRRRKEDIVIVVKAVVNVILFYSVLHSITLYWQSYFEKCSWPITIKEKSKHQTLQ